MLTLYIEIKREHLSIDHGNYITFSKDNILDKIDENKKKNTKKTVSIGIWVNSLKDGIFNENESHGYFLDDLQEFRNALQMITNL